MNQLTFRSHEPHWRDASLMSHRLPEMLRLWLLDESSLTRRLQIACDGSFHIELISLGWDRPLPGEALVLKVQPRQRALIRQVRLWCNAHPWVFARTVIPASSLRGAQRRLAYLGTRPLGAFLFSAPGLQRSAIQLAQLHADNHILTASGITHHEIWGRRSVFSLQHHPLLVSEFFLPDLPPFKERFTHESCD